MMSLADRECVISRISNGYTIYRIHDEVYRLNSPDPEIKYLASLIYKEAYNTAMFDGAMDENELLDYLMGNSLWSKENADTLEQLYKDLDDAKVKLYDCCFKTLEARSCRNTIDKIRKSIKILEAQKSRFDHLTAGGIASFCKASFLVGSCLRKPGGQPYWREPPQQYKEPDGLIEEIIEMSSDFHISEADYREIARTEPWRSIWVAAGIERQIFGVAPTQLTIEQKTLIFWSNVYESIREHPDCPHDSVISDDLLLDGWLIKEHRKREAEQKKRSAEDLISSNEKIQNASEIFIPVDTLDDAKRLSESLNSPEALAIKRQRFEKIRREGEVKEQHLPDVRNKLRMDLNKLGMQR